MGKTRGSESKSRGRTKSRSGEPSADSERIAEHARKLEDLLAALSPDKLTPASVAVDAEHFESLDIEEQEERKESLDPVVDLVVFELADWIANGGCPVSLPDVSTMPLIAATYKETGNADGRIWRANVSDRKQAKVMQFALESVVREDAWLLAGLLTTWLDENPDADTETVRRVRVLRAYISGVGLEPILSLALFVRFADDGRLAVPPFEAPKSENCSSRKVLYPTSYLDAYGDTLLAAGYPALAVRTWKLCKLGGPIPPSIVAKIAEVEWSGRVPATKH